VNAADRKIIVDSKYGKLEGTVVTSKSGFQIDTFLGIQYAKTPERFSKPVPVDPWEGVKAAKKIPNACIQTFIFGPESPIKMPDSEDCLYLNLFAPHETHPITSYPVMVFIHGGGFSLGSSLEYGVEGITEWIVPKGVIFINFHYRLGLWGFFSTGTDEAKGNYGLWDQSLLLNWVRDNVEHFGGDPNKITVFGESAGSFSTSWQTVSPHSRDLFQNAILMSGSIFAPWFYDGDTVNVSLTVATKVGCNSKDSAEVVSCMKLKSNAELLTAIKNLEYEGIVHHGFTPRMDNDFFPQSTVEDLIKSSPPKPTIIGATKDELGLFIMPTDPAITMAWTVKDPKSFTIEQLRKNMREIFVDQGYPDACLMTELAVYHYVDSYGSRENGTFLTLAYMEFFGDFFFVAPAIREAHLRRESGSKVWLYEFDYFNPKFAPGSYHFYDLWYFFKMLLYRTNVYTDEELKVADYYTTLFTNFAKFGNPTETAIEGIQWEHTTSEFPERSLVIDNTLKMSNYFKRPAIAFWNELLPLLKKEHTKSCIQEARGNQKTAKEEL
jgi:carboxylesterase type B